MTRLFSDEFDTGASVSMEVDADNRELYVFHCPAGQGCIVNKWPLDSTHMAIALAKYEHFCGLEREVATGESQARPDS